MNYKWLINKMAFEKYAGVEYGYRALQLKDPKLLDELSKASLSDDNDKLKNIKKKIVFKHPRDYGYPNWNEKGIANIPYEYGDFKDIQDFMSGVNTDKFSNYKQMMDPYSGKTGKTNFIAGRDSAEKMVSYYDKLLKSLPKDRVFNQKEYNLNKKQYDQIFNKIMTQRILNNENAMKLSNDLTDAQYNASALEKQKANTSILNLPKRFKLRRDIKKINDKIFDIHQNISKVRDHGLSKKDLSDMEKYYYNMCKSTDRDIIEQYKKSLENSLKDKNNIAYEWGWR